MTALSDKHNEEIAKRLLLFASKDGVLAIHGLQAAMLDAATALACTPSHSTRSSDDLIEACAKLADDYEYLATGDWEATHGIECSLSEAIRALKNAAPCMPSHGTESVWPWVILYEDADAKPEVFVGEGAEEAARARYASAYMNWNCHLLRPAAMPSKGASIEDARKLLIEAQAEMKVIASYADDPETKVGLRATAHGYKRVIAQISRFLESTDQAARGIPSSTALRPEKGSDYAEWCRKYPKAAAGIIEHYESISSASACSPKEADRG